MKSTELLETLPAFLQEYLGATAPEWIVPPFENLGAGAWSFRVSDVPHALVAVKVLGNEADEMRINVGLAIDVPYVSTVAEYVNRLNNKELIFGRMFADGEIPFISEEGHGPCVIAMQEIVFGPSLSYDFPSSMQNLLNITARLAGQAHRNSSVLVEKFGGRLFADDDAAMLTLY
jgi:hypothetical protein